MPPASAPDREIVIEPDRSWFRIAWRDVLDYRDLILLLVRRNFVATYKQTVLGPVWYVVNPLAQVVIYTVIFGRLAGISTDGLPRPLFYLSGTLAWAYFTRCLSGTSYIFQGNSGLFGKVYFPRLVVPVSQIITNLIGVGIQLATFLCFWAYYKLFRADGAAIHMTSLVSWFPIVLLVGAANGMGVGLWISSLTVKYRDFSHMAGFLQSLWMYATPVVYPLSVVPDRWRWLSALNPMTAVLEICRYGFLGTGTLAWSHIGCSLLVSAVVFFSGVMVFNRTERTFIDTV